MLTNTPQRTYIAIDLKSFYASVECHERHLDALTTNLVVADTSRTNKTICLAVSPSLKSYGISGRARLFEVEQKIRQVNGKRQSMAPNHRFSGSSYDDRLLKSHPELKLSYITATPRMALYMEYSTRIYHIYLRYIAPEDIHVYSIDEVFMDVTAYLDTYKMTASQLAMQMIKDVLQETGITATAGIGTNLYLSKVAMDIMAKHTKPDEYGVRIATLDEQTYRKKLWDHHPLTDFWRVGKGYAKKLHDYGIYTMGDIARCSIGKESDFYNEDLLYRLFGVNAELLIDHAWGWEPCTMADIKAYKPASSSIGSGQVLQYPYDFAKARLIVHEMTDTLALQLVDKGLVTDQVVLTVGYDRENLSTPNKKNTYKGEVTTDHYGRKIPKHAHGTANLDCFTSSGKKIIKAALALYDQIVNPKLLIRRIHLTANHIIPESVSPSTNRSLGQMDLFTDYKALEKQQKIEEKELQKEKQMQHAILDIQKKYGKNAMLKGMNLEEGAMTKERNKQIGGHKA